MDELIGNHWGPKQQFLWDVYLVCCGTFEGKTWWQTIEFLGHLLKTPAMTTRNVNWACWEMLEYYLILFEYTIFVMVWPTKVCDIVAKLRQAVEETRDKPVVSINGSHFLYTTQARTLQLCWFRQPRYNSYSVVGREISSSWLLAKTMLMSCSLHPQKNWSNFATTWPFTLKNSNFAQGFGVFFHLSQRVAANSFRFWSSFTRWWTFSRHGKSEHFHHHLINPKKW